MKQPLTSCLLLALCTGAAFGQNSVVTPKDLVPKGLGHPSTITLDVVVTGRDGHPVPGLQASDFKVLDDGQPAQVQSFAAHTADAAKEPESVILVIDGVNTGFGGISVARAQINDFLTRQGDRLPVPVGIVLLTDTGLKPLGPSSQDGKVLLAQLNQQGAELRALGRREGFWVADEEMDISLRAMGRLAEAMSRAPGRKLMIWISPGWPLLDVPNLMLSPTEQRSLFATAVGFSEEMQQSQTTVYDVDPLGGWDAGSFKTFGWASFKKPIRKWPQAQPGNLALQVIAAHSGGLVLSGSNDVAGEVRQCAQDGEAWYTIRIAAQKAEKPDTWHSLKVTVDREGLTARTSDGYYAQP